MKRKYVIFDHDKNGYLCSGFTGITWEPLIQLADTFERESLAEYEIFKLPQGIYEIKPIFIKN